MGLWGCGGVGVWGCGGVGVWGRPCSARAMRATFWTRFPLKSPKAHPFQTPLYHPCLRSMPHCRPWETSFSGAGRWSIFHEWGWEDGLGGSGYGRLA